MLNKCIIPLSGGIDSTVMLYMAVNDKKYDEIHCISFDYNQRHKRELRCAKWHVNYLRNKGFNVFHKIIKIPFLQNIAPNNCLTNKKIKVPTKGVSSRKEQPASYVPNRNMILLSIAAAYAESIQAQEIYHGAMLNDMDGGFWDCLPEFFTNLNNTFACKNGSPIRVITPIQYMSKTDIIKKGLQLQVPFEKTWTDYTGESKADAKSANSKLRLEGFAACGVVDPLPYKQNLTSFWKKKNCKPIKYSSK